MTTTFQIDKASADRLARNLQRLPRSMARLEFIKALNAAGAPGKAVASARAARETGLLSKAMIVKIPRNREGVPTGVMIGASRKVQKPFRGRKTLGPKKAAKLISQGLKVRMRKPSRYAHLAEKKSPAIAAAARTLQTVGVARLHQKLEQGLALQAGLLPK